jgi:hypothetical protein
MRSIRCAGSTLPILLCSLAARADHPFPLPNWVVTPDLEYAVTYTSEHPYGCVIPGPGDDGNFVPVEVARDVANALDRGGPGSPGNPPGFHAGYMYLGFRSPDFAGNEPPGDPPFISQVQIFDCAPGRAHDDDDCDSGMALADVINLPATGYCSQSELAIRRVVGHELFHHVQYGYVGFENWPSWGGLPLEGTARMMEDQVYSDLDAYGTSFASDAVLYLDDPNRVWLKLGYRSALGWKYAAERYGTTAEEPQVGVDFIRRFWERVAQATENDHVDFIATFEDTIGEFSPGTTIHDFFADFSIANIAKEFDTSLLEDGARYRYIDDNDGDGTRFGPVGRVWTTTLPNVVIGATGLARFGAAYIEADITSSCSARSVFGLSTEGDYKGFAVLGVDGADRVRRLERGAGEDNAVAFVQRSGDEAYAKFFAVLIGRDDDAVVDWKLDCGPAGIQVRRPDAQYPAYVGPNIEPRTFIVRSVVTGPATLGAPTVLGLQSSDFTVYVGSNHVSANAAPVLTGLYVQGEYWLVVQAPPKPDTNTYDVFVNYGDSVFHSQTAAVSYEERLFDQMLTVDTSGSMADPTESPSIQAAVNAASLFADVARPEDRVGLVTFAGNDSEPDGDATLRNVLADATDAQRDAIKNELALLTPGGWTSIGDGLDVAGDEFPIHGSALGEDWIVLLSDGQENEALLWTQVEAAINSAGIRVNSIALGPDADQILLQEIATETNGDYYYVETGTLAEAASSGSLPNRLADVYAAASERIKGQERLWEFAGGVATGQSSTHEFLVQQGGIVEATLSVNWDDPADSLTATIVRPDGSVVTDGVGGARIHTGSTHVTAHVGEVAAGTWTVKLNGGAGTTDYVGALAGRDKQSASLQIFFTQYMDNLGAQAVGARFLRGLEQPIMALLVDRGGVVSGASVRAAVEHPDGTQIDLPLFDDGGHGDGNAGDGVYGNAYARTTVAAQPDLPDDPGNGRRGSYNVVVRAEGLDNAGQTFTRVRKGSFSVYEPRDPPPDADGDRVPTAYEDLHPCLDAGSDDADGDGDEDGLLNRDEWGLHGTDPCNADTDRGGESDASEVHRGANPFDPEDDALPRPLDVEVVDWRLEHIPFPLGGGLKPRANWIRYPVNTAYARVHVLRSASPDGPFVEIADLDPLAQGNFYYDESLVSGQTWYYRIEPEDLNGNRGAPSPVFSGTAKDEPVPPIGSVRINDDRPTTNSTTAKLRIDANADTTSMQRANDQNFAGAVWQPYAELSSWTLLPDPATGVAMVYVRLRDAAGNVSATYADDILVLPPSQTGRITGVALLEGASEHDAILVKVPGPGDVAPVYTSANGKFALDALLPGTYDLKLSRSGYASATLTGLVVAAGATTSAGTTTLAAIDADGDAIPDLDDNCTLHVNTDQRNTDGDAYGNRCDPDLDQNGVVNFTDLGLLKARFFGDDPDADFDGDGKVNFVDLGIMKEFMFSAPGPAGQLQ